MAGVFFFFSFISNVNGIFLDAFYFWNRTQKFHFRFYLSDLHFQKTKHEGFPKTMKNTIKVTAFI